MRITHLVSVLLLLASPAAAQDWSMPWSDPRDRPPRVDVSISAGMLMPSDWSTTTLLGSISPVSGVLEQVLVRDLRLEPDVLYGGALTYWRDRAGLRVQAGFSRSRLLTGNSTAPDGSSSVGGDMLVADVNTWLYDARAMIGIVPYSPSRRAVPYVFIGGGGITYDLSRTVTPPLFTFVQGGASTPTGSLVVRDANGTQFLVSVNELKLETEFAFNFGIGTDLRIPTGGSALGVRVEVADHVARSPVELNIRALDAAGGLTSASAVDFGLTHNLSAMAGLVFQFGR
jgi:hypothetical protein